MYTQFVHMHTHSCNSNVLAIAQVCSLHAERRVGGGGESERLRVTSQVLLCLACIQGYLKVSIQVLGPGDEPKHSPSLTEVHHDNIDIES